ncbi:hypothetical protein [Brevibacillus laterosporus]|uniref:Uncharacterized protein n=1 Tax=Brevibacillus laterosporus TaxID=1465 RepID=A0AAP8QDP8_BRELA|nr:hypothetical protein [Brevibacillus laterosporus]MED1665120.1 hypothetical protein [Brevibacillus laterosporus]MED1670298.1 hypothetical protein [Brevibacillus laterosporus]MED1718055.1 hypothetical protein [Brevibacillus laterosporus]PPA88047.1 hypothetical protein C4A76_09750 [Brevibacillus laterosporus]PPB05767.1 hypothetical protein C4A77_09525 [Brevibacillus laterosporus]
MQEELEARLENIERRSQRQIEAWEKELITDEDLINAKKRIEKERKETLEALQQLKQENSGDNMEKLSSKVKKLADELDSPDRLVVKNAVRQIVDSITITDRQFAEILWLVD